MSKASQLRQKAQEHLKKGRLEKAIEEYTRLVSVDSRNPNVYNELGDIYLKAGDRVQAVASFEKASSHYEKVALYNNSIAVCKKILRVVPNRLETIFKLGELKAKQHFAAEAESFFLQYMNGLLDEPQPAQPGVQERVELMLDLVPESEDVTTTAAELYAGIGLRTDAAELLARLVQRFRSAGDGERAAGCLERFNAIAEGLGPEDRARIEATLGAAAESGGAPGPPGAMSSPVPEPGVTEIPDPAAVFDEVASESANEGGGEEASSAVEAGREDAPATPAPGETVFEIPSADGGKDVSTAGAAPVAEKSEPPAGETVYEIPSNGGGVNGPAAGDDVSDASGTTNPDEAVYDIPAADDETADSLDDILDEVDGSVREAPATEKLAEEITSDVEEDDYRSHYDLGMAYLEMALYNEAIKEFQAASRSIQLQTKCLEMIGHSFIKLDNPRLAVKQLERGLAEAKANGGETLGINYNLGLAWEMLGDFDRARDHFEEVYIVDMTFRDVEEKMKKFNTVS